MNRARAIARLLMDTLRFGIATRRIWLPLMIVIGVAVVLFVAFVQVAVPVVLYPMA